jgi:hypothetical protein
MKSLPLLASILILGFGGCALPPTHSKPQPPAVSIYPPTKNHHDYATLDVRLIRGHLQPGVILKLAVSVDGIRHPFGKLIRLKPNPRGQHKVTLKFERIPGTKFVNPPDVNFCIGNCEQRRVDVAYNLRPPLQPTSGSPGYVVETWTAYGGQATGYVDAVWSASPPPPSPVYWGLLSANQWPIHNAPPNHQHQAVIGNNTIYFQSVAGWNPPGNTIAHVQGGKIAVETVTYGRQ